MEKRKNRDKSVIYVLYAAGSLIGSYTSYRTVLARVDLFLSRGVSVFVEVVK